MPSNVFRLHDYRGEHRQYYYLTPVLDEHGALVDEYHRIHKSDVNEWREPCCDCHLEELRHSCKICEKPSVFGPTLFAVPTRSRDNQAWREDFTKKNKGAFLPYLGKRRETDYYYKGISRRPQRWRTL